MCVPIYPTWHTPQIVWNFPKPSGFIALAESCIIYMNGADMRGVLPDLPGETEGEGDISRHFSLLLLRHGCK